MSAVQIFNTVHVNGSSPYDVHIGSGLNELIVQRAAESGAEQVAILHQPSMDDIASELDAALVAAGLKVLHLNVPVAENAKSL